jgi:hypothetical protein
MKLKSPYKEVYGAKSASFPFPVFHPPLQR